LRPSPAPRANRWADPWVTLFLNQPALVIIVLCYLWTWLNGIAAPKTVAEPSNLAPPDA